jgi:hypothetical protein
LKRVYKPKAQREQEAQQQQSPLSMQSPDLTHQDSEMIPEVNVERFQIAPPV